MTRSRIWRVCALLAPVCLWSGSVLSALLARQSPPPEVQADDEATAYVCPMHPDYTQPEPGACAQCGMNLVFSTPYDVRDYRLDFQTVPAVVRAGQPATLRFRIFHPGSGALITRFESVHDRQFHLFLISQDMEHFEHIHPELDADGTWSIDVTLPKDGYYKVLSDFLPTGGTSQFLARPLVTAGYSGDLTGDSAALVPDTTPTKTVEDITAAVTYDPPEFAPGTYTHFNFLLTDTKTGRPITDLQTYLGAFGHTLIMSEDMAEYVHSHPVDLAPGDPEAGPRPFMIPAGVDPETLRGGPEVIFEGLIPKPGRYRAWTQFRRNDKLHTFAFTFEAAASR